MSVISRRSGLVRRSRIKMPHRLAKKHKVRRFKSSRIALQQLEPFFRNVGRPGKSILESGRPLKKYGNMLPRELVANWLLTVVGDFLTSSERFEFTTDPSGGVGIIYDTITTVWTEHVIVRAANSDDTGISRQKSWMQLRRRSRRAVGPTLVGRRSLFSCSAPGRAQRGGPTGSRPPYPPLLRSCLGDRFRAFRGW